MTFLREETGAARLFHVLDPHETNRLVHIRDLLQFPPLPDCLSPQEKQEFQSRIFMLLTRGHLFDIDWNYSLFLASVLEIYCDAEAGVRLELSALKAAPDMPSRLQLFYNLHVFCFSHNIPMEPELWHAYFALCADLRQGGGLPKLHITGKKHRAILLTSQLLKGVHQPTRNVMTMAKMLEQDFGYEVAVLNTSENPRECTLPILYGKSCNFVPEYCGLQVEATTGIRVFTPMSDMPSARGYNEVFAFAQAWQPEFILNFGTYNFSGEYLGRFCHVISMMAGTDFPPTRTSREIVIFRAMTDEDERLMATFGMSDIPRIRTSYCYGMPEIAQRYRREDYSLSAEDVVLAVVGNRLGMEMTDENLSLFARILKLHPRLRLLFAGYLEDSEMAHITQTLPPEQIRFAGFITDVPSLFDNVCDGYLNPVRTGGGGSGAYALATALPVFTMNAGHVAANTHPDFVFPTEEAMLAAIRDFADHKDWAALQGKARARFAEISDRRVMLRDILSGAGLLH